MKIEERKFNKTEIYLLFYSKKIDFGRM